MAIDIIHFKSNKYLLDTTVDQKTLARVETRRKYELGNLVLEAGLSNELSTVVLGLLAEAKEKLASKEGETWRRRWWLKGDKFRIQTRN